MSLLLLLAFLLFFTANYASENTTECQVGTQWTSHYIVYECYSMDENGGTNHRSIGCSPLDKNNSITINVGDFYSEQHFRYQCSMNESGSTVYEIINCFDSNGQLMNVGEKRTMTDGNVISCYQEGRNVKKMTEKTGTKMKEPSSKCGCSQSAAESVVVRSKYTGPWHPTDDICSSSNVSFSEEPPSSSPAISETTTSSSPSTSALPPVETTSPLNTVVTSTEAGTNATDDCVDLLDICADLAPMCVDQFGSELEQIKALLLKLQISSYEDGSDENESDEEEVSTSAADGEKSTVADTNENEKPNASGSESEQDESAEDEDESKSGGKSSTTDCEKSGEGCAEANQAVEEEESNKDSVESCEENRETCSKCKRSVKRLVIAVCPKTCNACSRKDDLRLASLAGNFMEACSD